MRIDARVLALLLAASPAAAQIGNGSDVTGPGITNGGLGGGTYEAGGFRRSENAVFRTPNGTAIWASGEVACAVTGMVPVVEQRLREGPLTARPEVGGQVVDDAARQAIWGVMRGDSVDRSDPAEALAAALRGEADPRSRLGRRASDLVEALGGLLGKAASCPPRQRHIVAEPWEEAVVAYDRYLDARTELPPGDAVAGVHAVLGAFMDAALAAAAP